jgi:ParB family chromosome partitioning protein
MKRLLLMPLSNLEPSTDQPRKSFNEQAHQELTESIREVGVLEAIIIYQKDATDEYVLIG